MVTGDASPANRRQRASKPAECFNGPPAETLAVSPSSDRFLYGLSLMNDTPTSPSSHPVTEDVSGLPWPRRYAAYAKASGPGWLQGAITLGGGSLAGALFLGLIAGPGLLWLQPLAMVCGVVTLGAIAYVTLATGRRPFGLINEAVSPVLGWAWLIATIMANVVWCMPQFNLAVAAVRQNLMPVVAGEGGGGGMLDGTVGVVIISAVLLVVGLGCNVVYNSGGRGVRWIEHLLRVAVGLIVLAFIFVIGALISRGGLDFGAALRGMVPDPRKLFTPSETYTALIEAAGPHADYWHQKIVGLQRDRIVAAFATAVGINMTFLLPYTLLKKGWGSAQRELAIVDLALGLLIPFVLATACITLASSSAFHGKTADVLHADGTVQPHMAGAFHKVLDGRLIHADPALKGDAAALDAARATAPAGERELAAMLANRDNFNLASTLEPLAGKTIAQLVFGLGVLGMATSTLIVLMMMNGFAFRELLYKPDSGGVYMLGTLVAGIAGFCGPFVWGNADARAALAIPTSVIGGSLLPIACFTFLLLLNSKRVLGAAAPSGTGRLVVNLLLGTVTAITAFGSVWVLLGKGTWGTSGVVLLGVLAVLGLIGFVRRQSASAA